MKTLPAPPFATETKKEWLVTAGGRIRCRRCQARSKRTGLQCGAAAMRGKQVCRVHGGRSTGPKTATGRQRCAEAKTIHGQDTRAMRRVRTEKMQEMRTLFEVFVATLPPGTKYT